MERFPALIEDHIGDSRSISFEPLIMRATKGAGVHMVLNSLAGEKLQVLHFEFEFEYDEQIAGHVWPALVKILTTCNVALAQIL